MLPKKRRINKAIFPSSTVFQRQATSDLFSIKVSFPKDVVMTKISCVVSKKVSTSAVIRNQIRRRVYSAIEEIIPSLKQGALVVVYAKKGIDKATFQKIKSELKILLSKTEMIFEKKVS
jgi:ribonuclease P protein component